MDHVASVPSATSGRMRPEALALAALLHVAAAVAMWWLAMHAPIIQPEVEPIEITIEPAKPKPPEPPPPPPQQAKPQPPPPPIESIKPPAELEADKATSVRPSGEAPKDVAAPPPDSYEKPVPQPPTPPAPPTETAMVAPPAPSPVPPPDRPMLRPLPKPEAGPTIDSLPPPRPRPPVEKPPPAVAPPQPQRPVPPPPSANIRPQPMPSPLIAPRRSEPPAVARHSDTPTPPSSPFVNPADERARSTAEQNYLWQVIGRLRNYRYHLEQPTEQQGLTVVMVTIARNGQLLDATVVRSSGIAGMDQGVLNGIRQGAPYAPLPQSLSGPSARFRLPLVSIPEER
jgi:TonB family protein